MSNSWFLGKHDAASPRSMLPGDPEDEKEGEWLVNWTAIFALAMCLALWAIIFFTVEYGLTKACNQQLVSWCQHHL